MIAVLADAGYRSRVIGVLSLVVLVALFVVLEVVDRRPR